MRDTLTHIKNSLLEIYPDSEIKGFIRILFEHITQSQYSPFFLDRTLLSETQKEEINKILTRLKNQEPIQYILGETEFYGLKFHVCEDVLIPRPETEELVELILEENPTEKQLNILDIGTGSGNIPISLAKSRPNASLYAWDISEKALLVAHKNAEKNKVKVNFMHIDVFGDIPTDVTFDIIVSNPPYVLEMEKAEMERNVLDFEPHLALFVPDNKGLLYYNRIADIAKTLLNPLGRLYFEINKSKGEDTKSMLFDKGYIDVKIIKDLSQCDRIVSAILP